MKTFVATEEEKLSTQIANFCDVYPTYQALLKADTTKMDNQTKAVYSLFLS